MSTIIEVVGLRKKFGHKKVLQGLDFHADKGEFIALLGPNGSGKSTFLRILGSLLKPSNGILNLMGFSLPREAGYIREHVGMVTDQPLIYSDLTVEENLIFFGKLFSITNLSKRVEEILDLIGLLHVREEHAGILSKGMQQRLSVGRAILHNPEILLLDEPYSGLDQEASNNLDAMLELFSQEGKTILMASHDLAHTEKIANRFDILVDGIITKSIERTHLDLNLSTFFQDEMKRYYG